MSAASARERGNGHFKNGDFAKAIKYYEVAAKLGTGQVAALALQNAALCHLKVGAYAQCIDAATAALKKRTLSCTRPVAIEALHAIILGRTVPHWETCAMSRS